MQTKNDIKPGQWIYVYGQFKGRVVRIRRYEGTKYFDVEIGGVVLPYTIDQITTDLGVKNVR